METLETLNNTQKPARRELKLNRLKPRLREAATAVAVAVRVATSRVILEAKQKDWFVPVLFRAHTQNS